MKKTILISYLLCFYYPILCSENGKKIGTISLQRINIFDTTQSFSWIENIANSSHILTQEHIIRRELLFQENEILNDTLLLETGRNLRKLGFIGDIEIKKNLRNDSLIDLDIVIHDKWTLNLNFSAKRQGGINNFSTSMSEDNFIGLGQSLSLGYNNISNRLNPHGIEAYFRDRRLLVPNYNIVIQYKNSEDLRIATLLLEDPFYTESDSWADGVYLDQGVEKKRIYSKGTVEVEKYFRTNAQKVWAQYSINWKYKIRLGSAYLVQKSEQDSLFQNIFDDTNLLNISLGIMNRSFIIDHNINSIDRNEDIPLGYSLSFVLGKDIFKNKLYYILSQLQISSMMWNTYFSNSVSLQGYVRDNNFQDATLSLSTQAYTKLNAENLVVARVNGIYGLKWNSSKQTFLDSPSGVRGLPSFSYSGNQKIILNIEDRFATNIHIWIFNIGGVLFSDFGIIGEQDKKIFSEKVYKSVGIGLRILNEKQQGSGITRLDLAYNINNRAVEFIISTNQLFSAFNNIDIASPLSFQ